MRFSWNPLPSLLSADIRKNGLHNFVLNISNNTKHWLYVLLFMGWLPKVKDRLKALLCTLFVVYIFVPEVDWYLNPISIKIQSQKNSISESRIQYQFLRKSNKIQYQSTFFFLNPVFRLISLRIHHPFKRTILIQKKNLFLWKEKQRTISCENQHPSITEKHPF